MHNTLCCLCTAEYWLGVRHFARPPGHQRDNRLSLPSQPLIIIIIVVIVIRPPGNLARAVVVNVVLIVVVVRAARRLALALLVAARAGEVVDVVIVIVVCQRRCWRWCPRARGRLGLLGRLLDAELLARVDPAAGVSDALWWRGRRGTYSQYTSTAAERSKASARYNDSKAGRTVDRCGELLATDLREWLALR